MLFITVIKISLLHQRLTRVSIVTCPLKKTYVAERKKISICSVEYSAFCPNKVSGEDKAFSLSYEMYGVFPQLKLHCYMAAASLDVLKKKSSITTITPFSLHSSFENIVRF